MHDAAHRLADTINDTRYGPTEGTNVRKPTRAAIYARLSQDRTGESLSIAAQIALARARADERGWTVVDEYVDSNISASTGARRPQWERMLADIEAGTVDGIVAKNQDRLSRQWSGLGRLLDLCKLHHVAILLLDDEIDTTAADGRFKVQMLGAVAENEAAKLSERVKQQRERAALAGTYTGGRRPFGYAGREHREQDPTMIPGVTIIPAEAK
ncbi:MAG TPA: recombinase family protein, partial [Acidimicrobiia bacterium]